MYSMYASLVYNLLHFLDYHHLPVAMATVHFQYKCVYFLFCLTGVLASFQEVNTLTQVRVMIY